MKQRLSKPRRRLSKLSKPRAELLTSGQPAEPSASSGSQPIGCVACSSDKNSKATSSLFFKLLSNNVLICGRHRFVTHWMLDLFKASSSEEVGEAAFKPTWKAESEEEQADREVPFSVTEDRRLATGVTRFGQDAWETILNDYYFAPIRTPDDLKHRWSQLQFY